MFRKVALYSGLSCLFAILAAGQGLNTNASKDDWEEINFEFNSAVLSDGYPSLLRLADLLSKHAGYHVKVSGNTDNIGSNRANERLGLARANTVRDFLVKYGAKTTQITTTTNGENAPEARNYHHRYSKTDVARWMNRRVTLTVTDDQGRTVSAGSVGEAITAMAGQTPAPQCCDEILKRLDRLDEIARMLHDLTDQNANLRKQVDDLKAKQDALENQITGMPKPLTEQQTAQVVDTRLDKYHDPRFSLLGLNVGADDQRNITFTGKGRFFEPFKEHFGLQAEAEYLYFHTQSEGQADIGLVNRIGAFQGGLFASFKNVDMRGMGNGTVGEGAALFDWLFPLGRIGIYGTKAFLNNAIISDRNAQFISGTNTDGTPIYTTAPNLYVQNYLHVIDQVGVNTTLGLFGNNYLEANVGYLKSFGHADRPGGTVRFVFPVASRFAFTLEGGLNETLLTASNTGRAVVGFEWGNFLRPKQFLESKYAVPMDVPRVRYELLSRNVMRGASPPVADAGPNQIGVPAGTITLNGSRSYDPNGEALTYQWQQEGGPAVGISGANSAIATFGAQAGQTYQFILTVRNTSGLSASARTEVTTAAPQGVDILFFIANPTSINSGQSSQLSYQVLNATKVTISPGVGQVNAQNGVIAVSPTKTTTYTLTASNATSTQTANVTVNVQTPQVQVVSCSASPANITAGQSATITYQTVNATSVTVNNGVGNEQPVGSFVVSPTANTTYTLTASNQFGSATCNVTVNVTAAPVPTIVRFTADPTSIVSGGTSTLAWQVQNATTVTISPTVGTVGLVGTQDVKPTQTTTYTLTASNGTGQATATATVTVTAAVANPTITSFTANPTTSPSAGSPVVLTCLANNATSVAITGVGPVASNGQVTVKPQTTTTYTCVATGANGAQASATLTVPVATAPPIVVVVNGGNCSTTTGGALPGSTSTTTVCQTFNRTLQLDLSSSSSVNGPLSFYTTSVSNQAAVINPSSPTPTVQLSALFGDYFFNVLITDSKGNKATAVVEVELVSTTTPTPGHARH